MRMWEVGTSLMKSQPGRRLCLSERVSLRSFLSLSRPLHCLIRTGTTPQFSAADLPAYTAEEEDEPAWRKKLAEKKRVAATLPPGSMFDASTVTVTTDRSSEGYGDDEPAWKKTIAEKKKAGLIPPPKEAELPDAAKEPVWLSTAQSKAKVNRARKNSIRLQDVDRPKIAAQEAPERDLDQIEKAWREKKKEVWRFLLCCGDGGLIDLVGIEDRSFMAHQGSIYC